MDMQPSSASKTTRAYCTLCRSRCGAIYTVENGRMVRVEPDRDHPTGGALCAKGRAAPEIVHHPNRLAQPLRRRNPKGSADPGWEPISYEAALDEIAAKIGGIKARHGAEAVAMAITTPSGTAISDSLEWILRFAWQFGTPNLLTSVEVCNFQKDYAQAFTFGQPLGVPDFENADVFVLWGHNPARTWLAEAQRIAEARQRGAKVIVIDPKRDGSGEQADLWLRVRPGSDAALAMGAIRFLLDAEKFAEDFVRDWTDGTFLVDRDTNAKLSADDFVDGASGFVIIRPDGTLEAVDTSLAGPKHRKAALFFDGEVTGNDGRIRRCATALSLLREASEHWTAESVVLATGVDPEALAQFYTILAASNRISYYHWTGIAQSLAATQTTRAISSLFALRDDIDAAGGNRWFAGPAIGRIADASLLPPEQFRKALGLDELPLGPPRYGYITARDFAASVLGTAENRVKALIGFGANLLMTHPDADRTRHALMQLDFQVHCDLFMTPMADTADILLPVTAPWEHDAFRAGFEITAEAAGHLQFRPALLTPPGEARPDYAIVRGLARRLDLPGELWQGSLTDALDIVLKPVGLDVAQLRAKPEGITLSLPSTEKSYAQVDASGHVKGFATPSRRVELHSGLLQRHDYPAIAGAPLPTDPDPDFPILLTTAKSGYYTHSSLRNITSLRRRAADPSVEISTILAARTGLSDQDWARVCTENGEARMRVRINADLADDVAIAEFGWWQANEALGRQRTAVAGSATSSINAIIRDEERDPVSGAPPLRHVYCTIKRDAALSDGHWAGDRVFVVEHRQLIGDSIMQITLVPLDGGRVPAFMPGQHIGVALPGGAERRFYSLISDGASSGRLEIAVRRSPSADPARSFSMSHHVHDKLLPGERLLVTAPTGSFVISPHIERPIVCIAGGIGVTPFLSAFRAAQSGGQAPMSLHYIAGTLENASFSDELAALAARSDLLSFTLWLRHGTVPDRPHIRSGGDAALISASIDDALLARRPLFYLCGPKALMDDMRKTLVARGVPTADIIAEQFKSELALPPEIGPAKVTLARSGKSFVWTRAGGSLLSAATSAGISLPSGCQVGQCESCAVKVTSGRFLCQVETELDEDRCLTCQSIPLTDMVLDC